MKPIISTLTTALFILAALAGPALGAKIHVPADQPTIQAGIDAASDGDLVLVESGKYVENIDFLGKAITVQSIVGADSTIIDGNREGSVVTFVNLETEEAVIDGFTITNGSGTVDPIYGITYGGGIYCNGTSPTITNCRIMRNYAIRDYCYGGGIYSEYAYPGPTITNCTIMENIVGFHAGLFGSEAAAGAGICYYYVTSPTITNCTISKNFALGDGYGGGIRCMMSSPIITDCTISQNSASCIWAGGYGGGIYGHFNGAGPIVKRSIISKNTAKHGGGISCSFDGTIENCTISENLADDRGGGIYAYTCGPTITNCTFSGNTADRGGGIYCNTASPRVTNCILWEDSASSAPEIEEGYGSPLFTYCVVQGGWPGEGNIDADPLFIGGGNYHLRPQSPCIDAGTDEGVYEDMDGQSRPWGAGFDLGADEFSTEPCAVIATSGGQFFALYLIPAIALLFLSRRFLKR